MHTVQREGLWIIGEASPRLEQMKPLVCFRHEIPRDQIFESSHLGGLVQKFALTDEGKFIVSCCSAMKVDIYTDHLRYVTVIGCTAWLREEDHMQVALTWQ